MNVPNLTEFERGLLQISQEAAEVVAGIYSEAKEKGYVSKDGQMNGVSGIGSCIMYLDRRKPLYKFFAAINYDPNKFYFITIYGNQVRIDFRNLNNGQSYVLSKAAYDVITNRLRETYGWEIYNNVNID